LWISVHMNTYANSSVYGCQVFYRNDTISKEIATKLQSAINETLQPDHTKTAKPIGSDLYLFKNTDNSAVLIECGFISNPDDLSKLKDEDYQKQLAQLIYHSLEQ
ncbi:MAG: N-acetylmuramoyl-L-alanine amidase, partial [Clostridia bacterium]|nr:N-acetylmuramoyl-L-alanine amidase [Clostridia bacterium]